MTDASEMTTQQRREASEELAKRIVDMLEGEPADIATTALSTALASTLVCVYAPESIPNVLHQVHCLLHYRTQALIVAAGDHAPNPQGH